MGSFSQLCGGCTRLFRPLLFLRESQFSLKAAEWESTISYCSCETSARGMRFGSHSAGFKETHFSEPGFHRSRV